MYWSSDKREDKITLGRDEKDKNPETQLFKQYGYYMMAFNTYRGTSLNHDDILLWKHSEANDTGKGTWDRMSYIKIRGQMSTSLNI